MTTRDVTVDGDFCQGIDQDMQWENIKTFQYRNQRKIIRWHSRELKREITRQEGRGFDIAIQLSILCGLHSLRQSLEMIHLPLSWQIEWSCIDDGDGRWFLVINTAVVHVLHVLHVLASYLVGVVVYNMIRGECLLILYPWVVEEMVWIGSSSFPPSLPPTLLPNRHLFRLKMITERIHRSLTTGRGRQREGHPEQVHERQSGN